MAFRAIATAALLAIGAAACGSDITEQSGPIIGAWAVVSVDGEPLPVSFEALVQDRVCVIQVSSITLDFATTGRYSGRDVVSARCGTDPQQDISRDYSGTFRTTDTLLYMREGSGVEAASQYAVSGSTLTITDTDGSVTVLQRR